MVVILTPIVLMVVGIAGYILYVVFPLHSRGTVFVGAICCVARSWLLPFRDHESLRKVLGIPESV